MRKKIRVAAANSARYGSSRLPGKPLALLAGRPMTVQGAAMIVRLNQPHPEYPDLTPGQPYFVIGIEADDYRLLNDFGRPYLYPSDRFEVLDRREPEDWVSERGAEGERYAYPAALNEPGFFEDFFDARPDVVTTFWQVVNQRLSSAA